MTAIILLVVAGVAVWFFLGRSGATTSDAPKARLQNARTAHDALPKLTLQGDVLRTQSGSYTAYVAVDAAPNFYLLDRSSQEAAVQAFHSLILGTRVVQMEVSLPSIRVSLADHSARMHKAAGAAQDVRDQSLLQEMGDWFDYLAGNVRPLQRGQYIVVTYTGNRRRRGPVSERVQTEEAGVVLQQESERIIGALDSMGCAAHRMSGKEIAELLWQTLQRDRAKISSMDDQWGQGQGNLVSVAGEMRTLRARLGVVRGER